MFRKVAQIHSESIKAAAAAHEAAAMNVSIQTTTGLKVYKELIGRENKGGAIWEQKFGLATQLKPMDPQKLITVNGLEAACAMPMPLELQLFQLQKESAKVKVANKKWEQKFMPTESTYPVSESSIAVWGDEKANSQRPKATGEPLRPERGDVQCYHSRGASDIDGPPRMKNSWSIDSTYYGKIPIGSAHLKARALRAAYQEEQ